MNPELLKRAAELLSFVHCTSSGLAQHEVSEVINNLRHQAQVIEVDQEKQKDLTYQEVEKTILRRVKDSEIPPACLVDFHNAVAQKLQNIEVEKINNPKTNAS